MSIKDQFKQAEKDLLKQGIILKLNVNSCCRSCADTETGDIPVIWSFAGQGNRLPLSRAEEFWGVYLYHSYLTEEKKEKALNIFFSNGFDVEWDKSDHQAIKINFKIKAVA